MSTQDFESSSWCWINEKRGKKILVGSVYRSTSSTDENNALLLEKIRKAYEIAGDNRILLLGDFNVPKVDWAEMSLLKGAKIIDCQMLNVTEDCFLYQHVMEPTRFKNNESSTLDLIFTKEDGDIRNIEILQPLGSSDHGIVSADLVCEWKSKVVQKPNRMYHKGKYDKIAEGLNQIDWDTCFEGRSVQECWDIFKERLKTLEIENIPLYTPKGLYKEPWMNRPLMKQWKKKYFAWKRFTENRSYSRYQEYKKEASLMKKTCKKDKESIREKNS